MDKAAVLAVITNNGAAGGFGLLKSGNEVFDPNCAARALPHQTTPWRRAWQEQ
jgi:hypothetical protein